MLLSTRSCMPLKLYEDCFFFSLEKLRVVTKIGNLRGIMTKLEFFSFLQQSKELHEKTWLQNIILRKN